MSFFLVWGGAVLLSFYNSIYTQYSLNLLDNMSETKVRRRVLFRFREMQHCITLLEHSLNRNLNDNHVPYIFALFQKKKKK